MIKQSQVMILTLALASAGAVASSWYYADAAVAQSKAELAAHTLALTLQPLQENRRLLGELQTAPFDESNAEVLEAYLAKIRRDGVAKNAQMKRLLDELEENNAAVATLLTAYAPHARRAEFIAESQAFRNYARAWRERWNSVMDVYMSGGSFPAPGVPFPTHFAAAVRAEIDAAGAPPN